MKTTKIIGLWLDRTSDPTSPRWIVSQDEMNEHGEAESTRTIYVMSNYDRAEAAAIELARKEGKPVIFTAEDGTQKVLYAGKVIAIRDGIGHLSVTVRLQGGVMDCPEWVSSILAANGCEVDEEMDDADIEQEILRAFSGEGYEGAPVENGLTVRCENEKVNIARRA